MSCEPQILCLKPRLPSIFSVTCANRFNLLMSCLIDLMSLHTDQVLTQLKEGSCLILKQEYFCPLERKTWSPDTGKESLLGLFSRTVLS
jgi:hypothetical protein